MGVTGDGSNIAFGLPAAGATENNVSGTLTITSNTLTNALASGTTTSVSTGSGIQLIANGSVDRRNVTQAAFSNNTIRNFPSGEAIQAQGGNGNIGDPGGTFCIPQHRQHPHDLRQHHRQGRDGAMWCRRNRH